METVQEWEKVLTNTAKVFMNPFQTVVLELAPAKLDI
jgi:hypothetical protein